MADNNNDEKAKTDATAADDAAAAKQKQEEELQKAKDELKHIINTSKPKNLGQGLSSGVGNMLGGCVGGVGVVVLAPTLGLAMGTKQGGLLGGVFGLTAGAVVGVVGGAAMIVGGAISGVTQMIRGVAAQPEAMMAPGKGKWWNDAIGKWVYTDLPDEGQKVSGLPEDDKDILGDLEDEIKASEKKGPSGNVVDPYYYDILEVGTEAEPSAIKRKYYVLARKYHPDKVGPDDKEAADKFKDIAEAYQVLSDPELRSKYDRDGRAGLSADKTEVADDGQPKIDPAILFAFLFGSDKFNNYIGRLSTATSASIGDSPKVSVTDAREIQRRRCIRIAVYMAEKLQPWVAEDYDACKAMWASEAEELSKASFGHQLVTLIGQVYDLSGEIFLGAIDSGIGIPSMSKWGKMQQAKMKKRKASQKNQMETLKVGMEVMGKQNKYAQELANAKTDEEKQKVQEKMEEELSGSLLRILWTTTVVDITSTLHEVVKLLLHDQSIDVTTRTKRAYGLKEFGRIWNECPVPKNKDGEEEKDAKKLYEEAAFAAMLETIQRKDEAAHGGGH